MPNGHNIDGTATAAEPTATITPQGALVQAVYTRRRVRYYAMNESDVENISMFSTITTSALSAAGAALGWILNIWWDMATTAPGVTLPARLGDPIVKVLWGFVVVCLVIAGVATYKKRNRLLVEPTITRLSKPNAPSTLSLGL